MSLVISRRPIDSSQKCERAHFTGEITEIHTISCLLDVTQLIPDSRLPAPVSLDLLITPAVKSSFHDCVDPACLSFLCSWNIPCRV